MPKKYIYFHETKTGSRWRQVNVNEVNVHDIDNGPFFHAQ